MMHPRQRGLISSKLIATLLWLFIVISSQMLICSCASLGSQLENEKTYQGGLSDILPTFFHTNEDSDNEILRLDGNPDSKFTSSMGQLLNLLDSKNGEQQREKRPSNGLLGLDNLDFAASTLDKVRSRSRIPSSEAGWELAQEMSKQMSARVSPSQSRDRMSMSVSMPELRRMINMMKAGRR